MGCKLNKYTIVDANSLELISIGPISIGPISIGQGVAARTLTSTVTGNGDRSANLSENTYGCDGHH